MQQGLAFLEARYNPELGLLNESPQVAPHKYWLTNDNALAAHAFYQLNRPQMSADIQSALQGYGYGTHGLIEVVWAKPAVFPPYVALPLLVSKEGTDEIWQEFHDDGPRMEDWAEYANLSFFGALNEYHQRHRAEALTIYSDTMALFDGTGFRDKAFEELYETYKLALALYTGTVIGASVPSGDQLLDVLQAMQTTEGGFRTHYRDMHTPEGDANTETTAMALLALNVYGCAPQGSEK